jgi:hypothetical protein
MSDGGGGDLQVADCGPCVSLRIETPEEQSLLSEASSSSAEIYVIVQLDTFHSTSCL